MSTPRSLKPPALGESSYVIELASLKLALNFVDRTGSGSPVVASVVETEILSATDAVELERNE
jgi:hypothetical protein